LSVERGVLAGLIILASGLASAVASSDPAPERVLIDTNPGIDDSTMDRNLV
jgi:hypothetical protein